MAVAISVKKITEVKDGVVLTLSQEEAVFLHIVLSRVGGIPAHSIRKYLEPIYDALSEAGIRHTCPTPYLAIDSEIKCKDHMLGEFLQNEVYK